MLTYKQAGVDIDVGNQLVEKIKPLIKTTNRPGVMQNIGGFGGLFELPSNYRKPVLVSGTDGVGTKLKLAIALNSHKTIGIDLVAMCVNDLIVQGAEPLFFLDYYATANLSLTTAQEIISGIAAGCRLANCALIGGETAEMPGVYSGEDYDLAGFCTGIVEKDKIIDGKNVKAGDAIIALKSSGFHSNGYSLIRKIIKDQELDLNAQLTEQSATLGEVLLKPTEIYVKSILDLIKKIDIKAIAHITGGGLLDNIPRVLPSNLTAKINTKSWQIPKVFEMFQTAGQIPQSDMWRTFNCGVGMIVVVNQDDVSLALDSLATHSPWVIGEITQEIIGVRVELI